MHEEHGLLTEDLTNLTFFDLPYPSSRETNPICIKKTRNLQFKSYSIMLCWSCYVQTPVQNILYLQTVKSHTRV